MNFLKDQPAIQVQCIRLTLLHTYRLQIFQWLIFELVVRLTIRVARICCAEGNGVRCKGFCNPSIGLIAQFLEGLRHTSHSRCQTWSRWCKGGCRILHICRHPRPWLCCKALSLPPLCPSGGGCCTAAIQSMTSVSLAAI